MDLGRNALTSTSLSLGLAILHKAGLSTASYTQLDGETNFSRQEILQVGSLKIFNLRRKQQLQRTCYSSVKKAT